MAVAPVHLHSLRSSNFDRHFIVMILYLRDEGWRGSGGRRSLVKVVEGNVLDRTTINNKVNASIGKTLKKTHSKGVGKITKTHSK